MENFYTWFDDPDFIKNQELLKKQNQMLNSGIELNKKDPFAIENVFDSKKALPEEKLNVPLLDKSKLFSVFESNNKIEESPFASESKPGFLNKITSLFKKPETGEESSFLGDKSIGENAANFGMGTLKTLKTTNQGDADGIMNTLDLGMKGAQLGMSVGGPVGAAIGGGAGALIGLVDTFNDFGKVGAEQRKQNKIRKEKLHTKLEQEQRQKDGLSSLEKLTTLRKQQENFII